MIGGEVIETMEFHRKYPSGEVKHLLWIRCRGLAGEEGQFCAINVLADAKARCVSEGDEIWWQGVHAYWTPAQFRGSSDRREGVTYNIKLDRYGYSGDFRPLVDEQNYEIIKPEDLRPLEIQ